MKKYPKMKDSGIKWIEEIPEEWNMKKLSMLTQNGRSITYGIVQAGEDFPNGVRYIRPVDMTNENGIKKNKELLRTDPVIAKKYERSTILSGDIVISIGPSFGKLMIVSEKHSGCNLTQGTARIAINKENFNHYIFWFLNSYFSKQQWVVSIAGATFSSLNLNQLSNTRIFVPSLEEQKQIGEFLNNKIRKIDLDIQKNQKLIKLLEEKRLNIIYQSITKGLVPSVKMKESGIEWVEKIPEHWNVIPFKFLLIQRMDNGVFKKKNEFGEGIKLVNVVDIYQKDGIVNQEKLELVKVDENELVKYSVMENDIFFVRSSLKLEGIGVSSIVKNIKEPIVFECHIIRTRSDIQKIEPMYLKYLLNSSKFRDHLISLSQTVTMTTISQDHIKNLKIIIPSKSEQKRIVEHIEIKNNHIERLILKLQLQIKKIQESRQSLITSVITGKIDVREAIV
jgi:type I restriction enzyme, S subunit